MMYRRIITISAQAEILEIEQWYNNCQPKLGDRFWEAATHLLDLLQERPLAYPVDSESDSPDIRKARMKRFPHFVLYRVKDDEVTILSVVHGHRQRGPRWRS